jgi:catechol 2,3-dioxygenase-like lactoylglutathione lyase family enzyme
MSDDVSITGVHHVSFTCRDVEASAAWYQRVLGFTRLPVTFPHHDREDTGYAVILLHPTTGLVLGLHHNTGNDGAAFDERRAGLDHLGFAVADRDALDAWAAKLDELGVEHTPVRDLTEPLPFATLVFRDPDDIQLELYAG